MADSDFELAFIDSLYDTGETDKKGKKIGDEMGVGIKYANYNAGGITSNMVSLSPFSYRKNINNSDIKLLLQIPVLTTIQTGNARTYQANSSLGLGIPLYKKFWSITPMLSVGAVGSQDQGAASMMRGMSLTNKLHTEIEGWALSLGTMLARYNTEPITINGYTSNPNIANNLLKNSIVLGLPIKNYSDYNAELNVTNTRYYGTDLFIDNAMDYGIGFIKNNHGSKTNNEVRFDIKYFSYRSNNISTIGNGSRRINGIMANLKFQY